MSDNYILAGNFDPDGEEGMPLPEEVRELISGESTTLTDGIFIDLKTARGKLVANGYGLDIEGKIIK